MGGARFDRAGGFLYGCGMSEMPQDAWFYAKEGERIGPVTFSELKVKAVEGTLNPRLDMIWTQGMAEWKPAGEIEGLFERKKPEPPPESLAPAADPYRPPVHGSAGELMAQQGEWPGIRRRAYLFLTIVFPLIFGFGLPFLLPVLSGVVPVDIMGFVALGLGLLPGLIGLIATFKRLSNVGMSLWWFLGYFVPILNFWVGYRVFACPAGFAYHKKMDGVGIFLAIVYWLLLLVTVLAVVAFVMVMMGAAGDPELREQLQKIIDEANATPATP